MSIEVTSRVAGYKMRAVRAEEPGAGPDDLRLSLTKRVVRGAKNNVVIEIASAAVNPSDVKAVLGAMPHAIWPRTPGRDYAGLVVEGPSHLLGKQVWGSGGELGIKRDGTHATYLTIEAEHVREKPSAISLREAGAVGVPFITAYEGLTAAGGVKPGDNVLVFGGNGKVGQAAIQIASLAGAAHIFGVERYAEPYLGHSDSRVDMVDASAVNVADYVRESTAGHGADIVYNTVGSPYFEAANKSLAIKGRQIFISTIERTVPFDIFSFYRGRHQFIGIDTLALDSGDCADILNELKPAFESGTLKPFPIKDEQVFPLDHAADAYKVVLTGSRERIVLAPNG
jgi:NADPH:quinone reductase-like Zn-dependent oxidoreductase